MRHGRRGAFSEDGVRRGEPTGAFHGELVHGELAGSDLVRDGELVGMIAPDRARTLRSVHFRFGAVGFREMSVRPTVNF